MQGGGILFTEFRQYVKERLKAEGITYAQLSLKAGVAESTIKCFMCRDDSRRVAEKIADALGVAIKYTGKKYVISDKEEN